MTDEQLRELVARLRAHISIQEWATMQDRAADAIKALMAERDVNRAPTPADIEIWNERKEAIARAERAEAGLRQIAEDKSEEPWRITAKSLREIARDYLAQIEKEKGR